MRREAARGCDGALRVWDAELAGAGTQVKALVLAAAAAGRGFDLVLAGAASLSSAGGQLGVLVAAHLGVPCVTQACAIEPAGAGPDAAGPDALVVTRALAGGYRERVAVTLPAVVTVVPPAEPPAHVAAVPDLLRWQTEAIPVWDLAQLGVPREAIQAAARPLRPGALRARTRAEADRRARPERAGVRPRPAAGRRHGAAPSGAGRARHARRARRRDRRHAERGRAGSTTCARTSPVLAGQAPRLPARRAVIPLAYRLSEPRAADRGRRAAPHAVCDLPLAVLRLDRRSAHLLEMTAGGAAVDELAAGLGMDPERVVRLCEYFRSRGLLDVELDRHGEHTRPA